MQGFSLYTLDIYAYLVYNKKSYCYVSQNLYKEDKTMTDNEKNVTKNEKKVIEAPHFDICADMQRMLHKEIVRQSSVVTRQDLDDVMLEMDGVG